MIAILALAAALSATESGADPAFALRVEPHTRLAASRSNPGYGIAAEITDGDTIRLEGGTRIRISGIDANERDGSCHAQCAPRSSAAATANLSRLVLHKRIVYRQTGTSFRRVVAHVWVNGVHVGCKQIAGGFAVRVERFDPKGELKGCER